MITEVIKRVVFTNPAWKVNERSTEKVNDGIENFKEGANLPLDLDQNKIIEANDENIPYAEEDRNNPEHDEFPKNMQQAPPGISHLILGKSTVRLMQNIRTSWKTTVMAFGGNTVAHLSKTIQLLNRGKIASIGILVATNNLLRTPKADETRWEEKMVTCRQHYGKNSNARW